MSNSPTSQLSAHTSERPNRNDPVSSSAAQAKSSLKKTAQKQYEARLDQQQSQIDALVLRVAALETNCGQGFSMTGDGSCAITNSTSENSLENDSRSVTSSTFTSTDSVHSNGPRTSRDGHSLGLFDIDTEITEMQFQIHEDWAKLPKLDTQTARQWLRAIYILRNDADFEQLLKTESEVDWAALHFTFGYFGEDLEYYYAAWREHLIAPYRHNSLRTLGQPDNITVDVLLDYLTNFEDKARSSVIIKELNRRKTIGSNPDSQSFVAEFFDRDNDYNDRTIRFLDDMPVPLAETVKHYCTQSDETKRLIAVTTVQYYFQESIRLARFMYPSAEAFESKVQLTPGYSGNSNSIPFGSPDSRMDRKPKNKRRNRSRYSKNKSTSNKDELNYF